MGRGTQGEKAAIVKELKEKGYRLDYLLKAIGLSRSTYYYEIKKADYDEVHNNEIMSEIRTIFEENHSRYGVRRVHRELIRRGFAVNHKKVQRLMHKMQLLGKRPKEKYHSYKGDIGKVADNIIKREFKAEKPLKKWTTDVSQFNFSWGKCYLSPILDMCTNEIISYDLSLNPVFSQVTDMLKSAFDKFPDTNGIIMHSDQGWQYQHVTYQIMLKEHGLIQSMSRKGNCYDNSIMETFFGRLKTEMYYGHEKDFKSFKEFKAAIDEYIDYYNNRRIQSKTNWMPPVRYRMASSAKTI